MKLFSYIIIAVVAIAIIAGFFVLGTPQAERLKKIDYQKTFNLQDLQYQVIEYWQNKKKLPENQDQLINDVIGKRPPVDPETKAPYVYRIVEGKELTFEICADFLTESGSSDLVEPYPLYGYYGTEPADWNWQHGIGQTCFERTIDPDLFSQPPNQYPKIIPTP